MANKKKTNKTFVVDWRFVLVLQAIASVALFISVLKLGALPTLYLVILGVALVILCGIFALIMKPKKGKKKQTVGKILAKIASVLVSIVLLFGTLYIEKGNSVLSNIANADKQITRYSVIVLADDTAEEITDLTTSVIESCQINDKPAHVTEVLNALALEANFDIEKVSDYETLATRLYEGEVDAILMNEAYKGLLEEKYPAFESETKVVWHYDIVEELADISKEADVTNETFTIYVSGIDTTGPISTVSRSDVNMLVTVNPVSKQILLTSIPRDYFVPMADSGIKDKLTHAGLKGVENSQKTIEDFLGIEVNYYAKVNFTSLETIVDALGGITVDSPYSFRSLHGSYWFDKGLNEMDGHKALCFVRERYSLPNGDNDRVRNQQLVIKAMLEKAMSPTIITNYTEILESIEGAFETNMTSNDIMKLIRMQLNDMSGWTFTSQQLAGYGATLTGGAYAPHQALYYMVPYEESVEECSNLIKQMTYSGE